MTKYKTDETIVVSKYIFIFPEFPAMGADIVHFKIFLNVNCQASLFTKEFYSI